MGGLKQSCKKNKSSENPGPGDARRTSKI
jgi:hypothetical protein